MSKTLLKVVIFFLISFCLIPPHVILSQTNSNAYYPTQLSLGRIYSVDWQPNGDIIAIAGSQGVRLYTDEFEFLKQLSSTETQLVSWSPDGTEIASVSQGQLTLWDVASGNSIFTLNGVGCPMSFSPDGNLLAVGIENGEIKIVNSLTGAVITTYLGQSVPNNEISTLWTQPETIGWSADGSSVISVGGKPQEIHVWDSQTGQFAKEVALEGFQHDQSCAKGMAWSPDRQQVFNLLDNPDTGSAAIWNIESGAVIAVTQEPLTLPEFIRTTWSPDGTKIALIDFDLNLTLWDATTLNVISTRELSPHSVYAPYITTGSRETEFNIDWSPDNTRILVSSIGGASILDIQTGVEIESLQGYTGWTNAIAWSPDGQYIATAHGSKNGYGDDRIRIWDANSGANVITCKGHIGSVNDIAWNSNGSQLASVAGNGTRADGTLRVWNVTTCQMLEGIWSGTLSVSAVDWKPDGTQIVLNGDGIVILSPDLAELETIPVYATTAQWSFNGEKLAIATINDSALRIYNAQDFTLASTFTGFSHPIVNIEWNLDGNKVATISDTDNDISINDISSGNRTILSGHSAPVTAISWNSQENLLASAGADNTIRIWDVASGNEVAVFENQEAITDLAWSPDGTELASSSYTGAITIWKPLPKSPSSLSVLLTASDKVELNWQDNSDNETNFQLERSSDHEASWQLVSNVPTGTTSYTDENLAPSTDYYYRVRAYRSSDNQYSDYSNKAQVLTPSAAPSNLAVIAAPSGKANLSWQDNSSDEATFRIERSPDGSTGWLEIGNVPANTTTYEDNGLTASTTYWYRVRALRSSDTQYSDYTQARSVVTAPAGVSQIAATLAAPYQIQISWTDNSADETNFHIERSLTGTSEWSEIGTAVANATLYADSTVNPSTTYYYRVRAYRTSDTVFSAYSVVSNGILTAPATPAGFSGVPLPINKAKLTWTDGSTDESNFSIERSDNGTNWTPLTTVAANQTTYADTRTSCIQTGYYRVRAYRSSDQKYSAYTPVVSVTTDGCGPDRLVLFNTLDRQTRRFTNFSGTTYNDYSLNAPVTSGQWVMGDWNGDGVDTPAVFNGDSHIFAFTNDPGPNSTWTSLTLTPDGVPVAGRFNLSRANDCLGIVDDIPWGVNDTAFALWFACDFTNLSPNIVELGYQWLGTPLANSAGYSTDGAHQFATGDFNTDGVDTVAVRRGPTVVYGNTPPTAQIAAIEFAQYFGNPYNGQYGGLYGTLVAGDWNYDGVDTFGYFYVDGNFFWRNHLDWNQPISGSALISQPYGTYVLPTTWRN